MLNIFINLICQYNHILVPLSKKRWDGHSGMHSLPVVCWLILLRDAEYCNSMQRSWHSELVPQVTTKEPLVETEIYFQSPSTEKGTTRPAYLWVLIHHWHVVGIQHAESSPDTFIECLCSSDSFIYSEYNKRRTGFPKCRLYYKYILLNFHMFDEFYITFMLLTDTFI